MKIFTDTAKLDEIKEAFSWGIVDGVTTNPSLIKKAVDALKAAGGQVAMDAVQRRQLLLGAEAGFRMGAGYLRRIIG